jgi:hypothetical protein
MKNRRPWIAGVLGIVLAVILGAGFSTPSASLGHTAAQNSSGLLTVARGKGVSSSSSSSSSSSGGAPASGHVGWNNGSQSMSASSTSIDGRINLEGTGFEALYLSDLTRDCDVSFVASGGYWGDGFNRFSPGWDGIGGEQYCGIGQINGVAAAGDATRGSVGALIRFGSTFWDDQPSDIKLIILNRPSDRPMVISKKNGGGGTRVLGACDGTVCNTTPNPAVEDNHNDGSNDPDIEDFDNQWVWVEHQWDVTPGGCALRTKLWTADETYQGYTIRKTPASCGSDEVTDLDILGFINSVETLGAGSHWDFQWLDIRLGSSADITPPEGFPGSAR